MRAPRHRPTRWTLRAGFVLLAGVWLLGAGLDGYHLATVRHARCEHGALVDLPAEAPNAPSAIGAETSAESRLTCAVGETPHDHHHCDALRGGDPRRALAPPGACQRGPLHRATVGVAGRDQLVPRTVSLYRLAPKNSPNV